MNKEKGGEYPRNPLDRSSQYPMYPPSWQYPYYMPPVAMMENREQKGQSNPYAPNASININFPMYIPYPQHSYPRPPYINYQQGNQQHGGQYKKPDYGNDYNNGSHNKK
eukprot:GHVR01073407.1.p1 GENE.GHVR01073407.1~~GHVR01073407.1.p1  ORF type:complete len:109 (+),score=3.17 GHVR01073407.1:44-370(+)